MIKLQVIGNLGRDCTVNNVNGRNVINFSVAHTERFKDSQGTQKERTTWVDCAYWTDRTAVAEYLKKGTQVYVEGQPEARAFDGKDGKAGASLQVRVNTVQLLGSRSSNSGGDNGGNSGGYSSQPSSAAVSDMNAPMDDLPF